MHIPAKASFWWKHSLQRAVQLMLLSVLARKSKKFIGAYWHFWLSPILPIFIRDADDQARGMGMEFSSREMSKRVQQRS